MALLRFHRRILLLAVYGAAAIGGWVATVDQRGRVLTSRRPYRYSQNHAPDAQNTRQLLGRLRRILGLASVTPIAIKILRCTVALVVTHSVTYWLIRSCRLSAGKRRR